VAYHRASRLVKVAAGRPPVLLDESMVTGPRGAVRNTVRDMAAARRRAAEAVGFVPPQDLKGIERVVVEAGREEPSAETTELLVGPGVNAESLLRLFGKKAYDALGSEDAQKWTHIFQRETNAGKRVVTAADATARFVDSYVAFHLRPKVLRSESPLAYGFFERLYGKRIDQLWDMVGR